MNASVFPVRHMNFSFQDREFTRYAYDGNPLASAWFMAFSVIIPYGEKLVIDGAREARDRITDPALRASIAALIGQEAMHSRHHKDFNEVLEQKGYQARRLDKQVAFFGKILDSLPHPIRLSLMASVEHMTGVWSQELLENPIHEARMSPWLRDVIMWHALEENEHKSVTFDLYQHLNGNYLLRVATLPLAAFAVVATPTLWGLGLLHDDGSLWDRRRLGDHWCGLGKLVGPQGIFNTRRLGHVLDYLRPSFHPEDHDTAALLVRTRERLLAGDGYLAPVMTKSVQPRG